MYLVIAFLAAYVWNIGAMFCQSVVLGRFLSQTSAIGDEADLERFKKVARLGMYLTLASIPSSLVGIGSALFLVLRYGLLGLIGVTIANVALFVIARIAKKQEVRSRSLTASSEQLAAEYKLVGEAWVQKAFPDF